MITVRECQYDEVKKFRDLEGEYHYMGESHGAGDMIRLIFEEDGKWIALMTWAAAIRLRHCSESPSRHARGATQAASTPLTKGFSRRRGDGNEGKDPVSGLAWWQGEQKLGEDVDRKRREADRHLKTP